MYYEVTDVVSQEVGSIARADDNGGHCFIPLDDGNTDYAAYLEWLAEGNTPLPWPPAE